MSFDPVTTPLLVTGVACAARVAVSQTYQATRASRKWCCMGKKDRPEPEEDVSAPPEDASATLSLAALPSNVGADKDEVLAKNPGDELTLPAPAPEEEDTEDDAEDTTVPTAVHESPIKNPEGDLALPPAPWPEEEEEADYTADTDTTFIDMMDQIAPAAAAVARPDKNKLKFKKGIPVKFKEDCAVCSVCGIM